MAAKDGGDGSTVFALEVAKSTCPSDRWIKGGRQYLADRREPSMMHVTCSIARLRPNEIKEKTVRLKSSLELAVVWVKSQLPWCSSMEDQ
jgi:hypothetical protein